MTISGLIVPIFLLLLFDGVFGNTLRAGLGSAVPAAAATSTTSLPASCS